MGQESLRNGTECMTMHTTMIWVALTGVQNTHVLFLEGQRSIPTLVEDELAENPPKRVCLCHNSQDSGIAKFKKVYDFVVFGEIYNCYGCIIADPQSETRLPYVSLDIYVPRDERFSSIKFSDFLAYSFKSIGQVILPEIKSIGDKTFNEFDTFEDVFNLYDGGIKLPSGATLNKIRERIPWEIFRELVRNDGEGFLKFPVPDVIKGELSASNISPSS